MSRVAMLLSNAYRPDPRVQREAQSLIEAGHQVSLYCWDRRAEFNAEETQGGLKIYRLMSLRSRYAAGWRQVLRLPLFWRWAIQQILQRPVDIVHCHDLDTLFAGVVVKHRSGCKLIFDAHEHYPTQMSLYLPKSFLGVINLWEKLLIQRTDQIITASHLLAEAYQRLTTLPIAVVGNAPALKSIPAVSREDIFTIRQQIGLVSSQFGLFYIGGFTNNRALSPLFSAMEDLEAWQLHLWGDGPQRPMVESAASRLKNVHYHGWAASDTLPYLFAAADAIYYCLRDDYPGAQYNAPNTLAHAMAASRPLIASDVGDLGRIVAEHRCGILLHEITPTAIQRALSALADPLTRQHLGENGHRAASRHYNWESFSKNLLDLYERLGH